MAKKATTDTAKKSKTLKGRKKGGALATTAKRVGRTPVRAAKGADKIKAVVKKAASGKRGKKKPKIDPEVDAARARNRALWKSQEKEAMSAELARHFPQSGEHVILNAELIRRQTIAQLEATQAQKEAAIAEQEAAKAAAETGNCRVSSRLVR